MQIHELDAEIEALKPGEVLTKSGLPDHVYHMSTGIGSSAMREAVKSMAHYKTYLEQERSPTPDMIIGSAIHTLVLEFDRFFDRFTLQPDDLTPGNNKAWKEWKSKQRLPILTQSDWDLINFAYLSVMDHAGGYFQGGEPEKSYWRRHPSGLILKARVDYQDGDLAVDLKSTKADTPQKFLNTIKYDYHIQDALYRYVTGLPDLIFIGVCKQPPHAIYAGRQSASLREKTDELIEATIQAIQVAEEFDDYPLPPVEILETE